MRQRQKRPALEVEEHDANGSRDSNQEHPRRHNEVYWLPGMPGCLQAVERSRRGTNRIKRLPGLSEPRHSADRFHQPVPAAFNGQPLSAEENKWFRENIATPACVKACPADCLRFGDRDEMLQVARDRISGHPDKYVDHIYGEKEAGGTS